MTYLPFTQEDIGQTYTDYVLKEVQGVTEATGITYDTTEYPLTISVSDAGNGKLTVDVKALKEEGGAEAEAVTFTNSYAAEGTGSISGMKTLTGRTLKADEFTFQVVDGKEM